MCLKSLTPLETETLRSILENDFREYIRYFFFLTNGLKFRFNSHHDQVIEEIMRCWRMEENRLIINIPPRYSKTEIVVIMFISWSLARNPYAQFIHLSYSDELALDNSARVLEIINSEEYQALWPIKMKSDRKSKALWRTEQGGGLKAGAAGGAVTGFGAGRPGDEFGGAMIIDDPLKPDDYEHEQVRKKTNRRMNATIKSRLNDRKTPIILIMQRLGDDDPAGFCLNGGTGDEWRHLKVPVVTKEGEPLWPFRHTMEDLVKIQVSDKYVWNSQYMQEPVPDEGDFFTQDNARWYKRVPAHLNYYGSSDYAASDHTGADYTVHLVWGVCPKGNIYLVDKWAGQTKADVWIDTQIDLMKKWNTQLWGGETGPIKAAVEPFLLRRMRERNAVCPLRWVNHSTANYKIANARNFQGLWEQGRIYFPEGKEWAMEVLRELLRFPFGTRDDQVDACSIFARLINKVWEKQPPPREKPVKILPVKTLNLNEWAPPMGKPAQKDEW